MMGPWAVGFRRATAVDERRGGRELPLAVWYPVARRPLGLYPWAWQWPSGRRLRRACREVHADGMLTPYEAQRILNKYAVAFLLRHLKGDTGSDAVFTTSPARHDEPLVEIIACHDGDVPSG